MPTISLNTACAITGIAKRTLWRYIQDGRLKTIRDTAGNKTQVELADARALNATQLTPEHEAIALAADSGEASAQCELALCLLDWQRPSLARDWFTQSARAGYPDAMCWLGQDLLLGELGPRDEPNGLFWLNQAAAHSSPFGEALIATFHSPAGQQARQTADITALKTLLDEATKHVLLTALDTTAEPL